jgi:hypothetical protein
VALREHVETDDLSRVIGWLAGEFGDRIDAGTIQRVAREEVQAFREAKVRLFVPSISWRLARARLQEHIELTRHHGVRA